MMLRSASCSSITNGTCQMPPRRQVDDALRVDVTKQGELVHDALLERVLRSAREHVWGQTSGTKCLNRVLRRLGFLFAHGADDGHERDVNQAKVIGAHAELNLTQRLDERHRFNITHRTSQLDHAHIRHTLRPVHRHVRHAFDPVWNPPVMWHHPHRLSEILTLALLGNHALRTHTRARDAHVTTHVSLTNSPHHPPHHPPTHACAPFIHSSIRLDLKTLASPPRLSSSPSPRLSHLIHLPRGDVMISRQRVHEPLVIPEIHRSPPSSNTYVSPCSNGDIVPASMLMYGSIFTLVTRNPLALRRTPMEEAVTPFPRPLTTPPETTTYFMTRDSRCDARASVAAARPRAPTEAADVPYDVRISDVW